MLYVLCFVQNGTAARQWWVSALYLVSLFPLVYITWSCVSLWLARPPFDRETSDDLSRRFEKMTLAYAALTGAAAVAGTVACLVLHSFVLPGDLLFLLGNGAATLLGLLLYSRRKSFETREISRYSEDFPRLMEAKNAKKQKR